MRYQRRAAATCGGTEVAKNCILRLATGATDEHDVQPSQLLNEGSEQWPDLTAELSSSTIYDSPKNNGAANSVPWTVAHRRCDYHLPPCSRVLAGRVHLFFLLCAPLYPLGL